MTGRTSRGLKSRKKVLVIILALLSFVLILALVVKKSDWYHKVIDSDAVSLGSQIKKMKLDTGITGIHSGYIVEEEGKKVQIEVPIEFWMMVVKDFANFSFVDTIKYRMNHVLRPKEDFKVFNNREIIGFELFLQDSNETITVKICEGGFIWIQDECYEVGEEYTKRYNQGGQAFLE